MFLRPVSRDDAPDAVQQMYEADERAWGFLPEFSQVFSHHPDAYEAWNQLIGAVRGQMDRRRCELATLAAARVFRSTYCATAHGKILRDRWYDAETMERLVADHRSAGLEELDVAVMDFAQKVAIDPTSVTAEDVDMRRALGLTERDILDVVLAVAARAFFATVVETFAAGPDPELRDPLEPDLREALTVGRRPG